jgi:hypothetical protein
MFVVITHHVWTDRRYGSRERSDGRVVGPFEADSSGYAWLESKGFKRVDRYTYWRETDGRLGNGEIGRVTHLVEPGIAR